VGNRALRIVLYTVLILGSVVMLAPLVWLVAATLKHPEHNALAIPEGRYVVYAQREYDETTNNRRVVD